MLTALRNQLTVYYHEDTPGPQDERILLAKSWMDSSPGAQEMFDLWSTINQVGPEASRRLYLFVYTFHSIRLDLMH